MQNRFSASLLLVSLLIVSARAQVQSVMRGNGSSAAANAAAQAASVNQATGAVSYAVPLGTVSDGDLSVALGAQYTSSGQIVAEKGGIAGLGWRLDIGGTLTREVRGLPDDATMGRWATSNEYSNTREQKDEAARRERDAEYDIFRYRVGGYAGAFFVTRDRVVRQVPQTDCRIELNVAGINDNSNIPIIGFDVTTPEGVAYRFGGLRDDVILANMTSSNTFGGGRQPEWHVEKRMPNYIRGDFLNYFPSEYLLRHIESPAGAQIDFNYAAQHRVESSYPSTSYISRVDDKYLDDLSRIHRGTTGIPMFYNEYKIDLESILNSYSQGLVLSYRDFDNSLGQKLVSQVNSIPYRAGSQVRFVYGAYEANFRDHNAHPSKPSGVSVTSYGHIDAKKPKLTHIELGSTDIRHGAHGRYTLEYYDGRINFPYPTFYLLSNGRSVGIKLDDYAGYAADPNWFYGYTTTIIGSKALVVEDREPDHALQKITMLRRVTLPSGGTISFDYEGNERALYENDATSASASWSGGGGSGPGDPNDPDGPRGPDGPQLTAIDLSRASIPEASSGNSAASFSLTTDNAAGANLAAITTVSWNSNVFPSLVLSITQASTGVTQRRSFSMAPGRNTTNRDLVSLLTAMFGAEHLYSRYNYNVSIDVVETPSTYSTFDGRIEISLPTADGVEPVPGMRVRSITSDPTGGGSIGSGQPQTTQYSYRFDEDGEDGRSSGFTRGRPVHFQYDGDDVQLFSDNTSSLPFASGSIIMYASVRVTDAAGHATVTRYRLPDSVKVGGETASILPAPIFDPLIGVPTSVRAYAAGESEPYASSHTVYEVQSTASISEGSYRVVYAPDGGVQSHRYYHPKRVSARVQETVSTLEGRTTRVNYEYNSYNISYPRSGDLFGPLPFRVTTTRPDGSTSSVYRRYTADYRPDNRIAERLLAKNIVAVPYYTSESSDGQPTAGTDIVFGTFDGSGYPQASGSIVAPITMKASAAPVNRSGTRIDGDGAEYRDMRQVTRLFADGTPREWIAFGSALRTRLTRDERGLLETEELLDSEGTVRAVTSYTYQDDLRLETVTGPDGVVVRHTYDDPRRIHRVVNECSGDATEDEAAPFGSVAGALAMSRTSLRSGWNDANWKTTWVTHDGFGRPIQTISSGRSIDNPDAGANGVGLVHSRTEYDELGRVARSYAPITRQLAAPSWDYGRRLVAPSTSARVTSRTYDSRGRLETTVAPDGSVSTISYGRNAAAIRDVGYLGQDYAPGSLQRRTVTDAWDHVSETFTNDRGQEVRSQRRAPGAAAFEVVDRGYNLKGELYRVVPGSVDIDDEDQQFSYGYTAFGQVKRKSVPGRDQSVYEYFAYDGHGRLAVHRTPHTMLEGKFWAYTYDIYGNLERTGLLSGNGHVASTIPSDRVYLHTKREYVQGAPSFGAVKETVTRLLGEQSNRRLRDVNDLSAVCGSVRSVTTYGYPGAYWGIGGRTYSYDEQNRVDGVHETLNYAGHTVSVSETSDVYADDSPYYSEVTVAVDGAQRRRGLTDVYAYDRFGQVERVQSGRDYTHPGTPGYRQYLQIRDYRYDRLGRLTHVNQPLADESSANYLSNGVDDFNAPADVTGSGTSDYVRKDLFHEEIRYGANGVVFGGAASASEHGRLIRSVVRSVRGRRPTVETYGYDAVMRLEHFEAYETPTAAESSVASSQRLVAEAHYAYDALARPTSIRRSSLGRFFAAVPHRAQFDNLTYDYEDGARVARITDGAYASGGHQRLWSTYGSPAYGYDEAGRVTLDPYRQLSFEYNELGLVARTTSLRSYDRGASTEYVYAYDGSLLETIERDGADAETGHIYHRGAHRYDATRGEIYLAHASGASLVDLATGETRAIGYETDYLGNVILAYTDANHDGWVDLSDPDELLEEQNYFPYGLKRQGYGRDRKGLPFAYNGAEWDERFGQHLTTYRTMAPATGLWSQVDPKAAKFPGYSPYSSMMGNPISYADPDGDEPISFLIGAGIGVIGNGIGNLLNDRPFFEGAGKAAFFGAIGGGISSGIGGIAQSMAANGVSQLGVAGFQAGAHALSGGFLSAAQGGNFWHGAAAGGLSSGIGSGIGALGGGDLAQIAGGTLAGGLGAKIAGGKFWHGAVQGAITSGLNHAAHELFSAGGPPWEFNGKQYTSKAALYRDILAYTAADQFGILEIAAFVAGQPILPTRGKFGNATGGTSPLSKGLRGLGALKPGQGLPAPTGYPKVLGGRGVRMMATKSVGAFAARWVPFVGQAVLAYDVGATFYKAQVQYNQIIGN